MAGQNSCKALVLCQDPGNPPYLPPGLGSQLISVFPEPSHLIYLRRKWLEEHPAWARPPGSGSGSEESGSDSGEEVNPMLLDPTQWKDQDHYAILGLGKLRYKATQQDIKKACEHVHV